MAQQALKTRLFQPLKDIHILLRIYL